jgi:hypothetical protein
MPYGWFVIDKSGEWVMGGNKSPANTGVEKDIGIPAFRSIKAAEDALRGFVEKKYQTFYRERPGYIATGIYHSANSETPSNIPSPGIAIVKTEVG